MQFEVKYSIGKNQLNITISSMIMCCSRFWKLHPRGNGLICVFIPPYSIWDWTWQIIIMKVDYTCIKQGTVYCNVQMTKTKVLHIFQELWKVACYSCKMKLLPLLVGWVTIHNLWEMCNNLVVANIVSCIRIYFFYVTGTWRSEQSWWDTLYWISASIMI